MPALKQQVLRTELFTCNWCNQPQPSSWRGSCGLDTRNNCRSKVGKAAVLLIEAVVPWGTVHRRAFHRRGGQGRQPGIRRVGLVFANIKLSDIVLRPIISFIHVTQPHAAIAEDLVQRFGLSVPLLQKHISLANVMLIV